MHAAVSNMHSWRIAPGRNVPLTQPVLIGVLNLTPDSFSDGGRFGGDSDAAVEDALRMIDEGATIIDIGGESTRPGAARIAAAEQQRRVLPVIQRLRAKTDAPISIDTTLRDVAEAALDAGAGIINDVAAGLEDPGLLSLAADRRCGLILMHRLRPPQQDSYSDRYDPHEDVRSGDSPSPQGSARAAPHYDDVVMSVKDFLDERRTAAMDAGVAREAIVLDPGLGFGKTVEQNFQLIAGMPDLLALGSPVLCAASRKSFIGAASGVEEPARRVNGSVAVAVACLLAGVRLFRVHDVAAHREALAVALRLCGNAGR